MKKSHLVGLLIFCFFFFFSNSRSVWATQDAIVTADTTDVRQEPDENTKTLQSLHSGDKIHISSGNKNGWYKIRVSEGRYGWVRQSDIAIQSSSPQVKSSDVELYKKNQDVPRDRRDFLDDPFLHLKLGGHGFGLVLRDLNSCLGLNKNDVFVALGGFGELQFEMANTYRIGLRITRYQSRYSVKHLGVDYEVTQSGLPILIGLDKDLYTSTRASIAIGMYAGMSPSTELTVKAPQLPTPNSFSLRETRAYSLLANASFKHWWSKWFSVFLELGFFYNYSRAHEIKGAFNGMEPFRDAYGNLNTIKLSHLGPTANFGFQLTFR